MRKRWLLIFFPIIYFLPNLIFSQQSSTDFPIAALRKLQKISKEDIEKELAPQQMDLIIGATDPNEFVKITGNYSLDGDIIILNNGVLEIDSADFTIDGDIRILGNGKLNVNGGTFRVIQEFAYEHNALVIEGGKITFQGVNFQSSSQSWSNAFGNAARYELINCQITNGFITTLLTDNASARVESTQLPGEFLCFSSSSLQMKSCDSLLIWFVLPEQSQIEFSFPGDSSVDHLSFSDDQPGIEGINYRVEIDDCRHPWWGLMSLSGSNAVFRDSEFRAIGLIFSQSDSIAVRNLTNDSQYTDEIISLPDRHLQLIRSDVRTWNFYAQKQTNLLIENCIFGELLSQDSSHVMIRNSICDGSGGYLGSFENSELLVVTSLIQSQVIARENSVLLGIESSFWGNKLVATDYAIMLIANTATRTDARAFSAAIIFEALLTPAQGAINDLVPILGTARIVKGEENPITFQGYKLAYSRLIETPDWQPMGDHHYESVKNDTLEIWDTENLPPGHYALRLGIYHSFGEPIEIFGNGYLYGESAVVSQHQLKKNYRLSQNYPNPFNAVTKIRFSLPVNSHVKITLFDVTGKEVRTLLNSQLESGKHELELNCEELASGIFFYRMEAGDFIQTKKLMVIR